jgi:hypothetical protein
LGLLALLLALPSLGSSHARSQSLGVLCSRADTDDGGYYSVAPGTDEEKASAIADAKTLPRRGRRLQHV